MYQVRQSKTFKLSQSFLDEYETLKSSKSTRKSHYLEGRFENIYLDENEFPALKVILAEAKQYAAEVLQTDKSLKVGHWFNEMQSGFRTLPHTHEENEELLSGVFYITAPEQSGDLLLGVGNGQQRIKPEVGKFVFFSPDLLHEVEKNESEQVRLSVGMNFFEVDEVLYV